MTTDQYDIDDARRRGARMPRSERRTQLLGAALESSSLRLPLGGDGRHRRAGRVSKPVLYQHFPGKLELYLALLEQSCDAMIGNVRER